MVSDPGTLGGAVYSPTSVASPGKLKKEAGIIGLLYAGVGGMIGSGWLFGPLNAAQQAGPLSLLAWVIGGAAVLSLALVYAELATMFPRSGVLVHMSHISHGRLVGRVWSWILILAYVTIAPVEAIAILSYAEAYVPGIIEPSTHVLTSKGMVWAFVLLAIMVGLNFLAIRLVLAFNSTATWIKLFIPVGTAVVLLTSSFHAENLTVPHESAEWHGIFTAISTAGIFFSLFGFRQAIDLAGETSNPGRNLPIAVIGTVIIGTVLYSLLQFAFIAAIDPALIAQGGWTKLTFAHSSGPFAALVMAVGATWWAVVLYADAVVSPAACGFIYTTTSSRIIMASGETGDLPRYLALINRNGVPWVALIASFLLGAIFFFPFPSWHKLVGYISSITVLSYGIGPILLLRLRLTLPDLPRAFTVKGAWFIAPIAFLFSNFIILWSGYDTVRFLFLLLTIFACIYFAYFIFVAQGNFDDLDIAHALWLLPYFGGMFLISMLGPKDLGGEGLMNFETASLATIALSIVILYIALRSTLPEERLVGEIRRVAEAPSAASH